MSIHQLKNIAKKIPYLSFCYWRAMRVVNHFKMKYPRKYKSWIKKSEIFTPFNEITDNPKFIIVINDPALTNKQLNRILKSISEQSYQYWQAKVVIHGQQEIGSKLKNKSRIQFVLAEQSELLQKIDTQLPDRWLMFINHYLLLAPQALWEFVVEINLKQTPNLGCVYSDHDHLDKRGIRENVNFKPSWNPDLFYEQNYIANCCVYQGSIFKSISIIELNSQDDLFKLIINLDEPENDVAIGHIAKVLFHFGEDNLKLDVIKSEQALQQRFNIDVKVNATDEGQKVTWPISNPEPLVSLIIPTRNGLEILQQAVDSILLKTTYQSFEIIIVDNQSDDPETISYLASLKNSKIRVIAYNHPFNYSAINNFAVQHAKGSLIGLINNDVEVISPEWLTEMVSQVIRPEIGCVGAKLYYPNDTIQHAGVIIGLWGCAGHSHKYYERESTGYQGRLKLTQNYSAVTAACLLVKKNVFHQVSGLNENDLTVAFNDVDFCLKVEALGLRNLWTPYAQLYHYESISRGNDSTPEKRARVEKEIQYMHSTWQTNNYNDPAYNKNLNLSLEDFSITRS